MATTSKSFGYKTKIIGRTLANNNTLDTEVVVPLKYLSNFWRSLNLPLFSCDLSWSKDCRISETSRTPAVPANPAAEPPIAYAPATETAGATFQINSTNSTLCPNIYFVYKE